MFFGILRRKRVPIRLPEGGIKGGISLYQKATDQAKDRLILVGFLALISYGAIGVHLVQMGGGGMVKVYQPKLALEGEHVKMKRAEILDRNGVPLATNLKSYALSADPRLVINPKKLAVKLAKIFPNISFKKIYGRITRKAKFVWISRRLTPSQQVAVNHLGQPALQFHKTEYRVYPQGPMVSHILGYTDIDGHGIAGVEKSFNTSLENGKPVRLTIDIRAQHILRDVMEKTVKKFSPKGASGVVMDVKTGDIVAMVSLPDFDPNAPGKSSDNARFNRATLGVYELGSVFKIFNTALWLKSGIGPLTQRYNAADPLKIGRFKIHDFHAKRRFLAIPEVFIYSSNIASAKMALDVGRKRQEAFMGALGFLKPLTVQIPEKGHPLYPRVWRPANTATIAYGHALSVSPLHLTTALSAIVNGGIYHDANLIKGQEDKKGRRIISSKTSNDIRRIMWLNGVKGSGRKARVMGYLVGGKTGTSEKASAHGYRRRAVLASYAAAFPIDNPRFAIYIMLDEPKRLKETYGYATGGWNAAPAVGNVIRRLGPLYNMIMEDENSPKVLRSVGIYPKGYIYKEGQRMVAYEGH